MSVTPRARVAVHVTHGPPHVQQSTGAYTKECLIAESTFMATSVYRPSHVTKSNAYRVASATRVARIMTSSFTTYSDASAKSSVAGLLIR
jgi:hypothetical protein